MGYYSQVALVLTGAAAQALDHAGMAATSAIQDALTVLFEDPSVQRVVDPTSGQVLYFWDWCKWNDDDPDSAWLLQWLDDRPITDFRYRRVGEADGDLDDAGVLEDRFDLRVIRLLEFSTPETPAAATTLPVPLEDPSHARNH